jgi:hypothetical protein
MRPIKSTSDSVSNKAKYLVKSSSDNASDKATYQSKSESVKTKQQGKNESDKAMHFMSKKAVYKI